MIRPLLAALVLLPSLSAAAPPVNLDADSYKPDLGVLIVQVNWGRTWKCGRFENAQLQALSFTKAPLDGPDSVSLDLVTPSKLTVDNKFLPYAYVVQPGEYLLTGFDVKVARSVKEVLHIEGTMDNLISEGDPLGGSFTVNPGEIVYIGHFGLDCATEPFLWRFYIEERAEFEKYIRGFREVFPFAKDVPVQFRLFSTQVFGKPFSLQDPTVK